MDRTKELTRLADTSAPPAKARKRLTAEQQTIAVAHLPAAKAAVPRGMSRELREDMAGGAMLAVCEQAASFDPESGKRFAVSKRATGGAKDARRKALGWFSAAPNRDNNRQPEIGHAAATTAVDDERAGIDRGFERVEQRELLAMIARRLTERERFAFGMRVVRELSFPEIGEALGMSEASARRLCVATALKVARIRRELSIDDPRG